MIEKDFPVLDYLPNALRSTEVAHMFGDETLKRLLYEVMTPENVLNTREFEHPEIITPQGYPTFDALCANREKIRMLRLLPIKTHEEYIRYHKQEKEHLIDQVEGLLGDSPLVVALNMYPYFLPEDLGQYIIWIKEPKTPIPDIAEFASKIMRILDLSIDEVILFERPIGINSKIVKGTFTPVRHIHFWIKLK